MLAADLVALFQNVVPMVAPGSLNMSSAVHTIACMSSEMGSFVMFVYAMKSSILFSYILWTILRKFAYFMKMRLFLICPLVGRDEVEGLSIIIGGCE